MPTELFTRGLLAKQAGVGPETIRYYERIGLLREPRRNAAGHRLYSPADLGRLRFIKRAQELGFSLEDVRELIAPRVRKASDCCDVERRATRRLADIRDRIRDLERVEESLKQLIGACRANPIKKACPILEVLESEEPLLDVSRR
ncbi:MAG TPA: MerR family transcriptional regulator [Gemmatimonadota bacterium]|jgi:Hg(II)-responsive transcriptional regulator